MSTDVPPDPGPQGAVRGRSRTRRGMRLERLCAKIHLWIAFGLGIYIVVLSVSGSVAVFRPEASLWLVPRFVESTEGAALTGTALAAAVEQAYPEHEIERIVEPTRERAPVYVALIRDGRESSRLFDQYTARDLGDTYPALLRAMEWTVDLHDNLLSGRTGRTINGVGGAIVLVLVLTGAVLWWPGARRWHRGFMIRRTAGRSLISQLHAALGAWTFALLLVWTVTAVYFAFPGPVESLIDRLDGDPTDFERPGERIVTTLVALHFGRFGGLEVRFLWALLGLVPAVMLVTGYLIWRRRKRAPSSRAG